MSSVFEIILGVALIALGTYSVAEGCLNRNVSQIALGTPVITVGVVNIVLGLRRPK